MPTPTLYLICGSSEVFRGHVNLALRRELSDRGIE